MIQIRRAEAKDLPGVLNLLSQVLEVHAEIRPDLFVSGTRKYTQPELLEIFQDDSRPVFVATDGEEMAGYCFCVLQETAGANNLRDSRSLYIDDLCVDERCRGQHVGRMLNDHVLAYAREQGCYDVTLNVWAGNDRAMAFYQKMGYSVRKVTMERIL